MLVAVICRLGAVFAARTLAVVMLHFFFWRANRVVVVVVPPPLKKTHPDRQGPSSISVENSAELSGLEITGISETYTHKMNSTDPVSASTAS